MLIPNFYSVKQTEDLGNGKYLIHILVNSKHEVFKGHFPGNPVMPGVCMMQIIKELTEGISNKSVQLTSMTNVKFMALINPETNSELRLDLEIIPIDEGVKVKNTTYFDETTALKFSGQYKFTT